MDIWESGIVLAYCYKEEGTQYYLSETKCGMKPNITDQLIIIYTVRRNFS